MTIQDLQGRLVGLATAPEWDRFIVDNIGEIRALFYGLTAQEIKTKRFGYEKVFLNLVNSKAFQARVADNTPAVKALLVFFLAFWERAELWTRIQETATCLAEGPLRSKAMALFQYKYITDAHVQFTERLEIILDLLNPVWSIADDAGKRSCEGIMTEYFLDARLGSGDHGPLIATKLATRIRSEELRARYPLVEALRLDPFLEMDLARLEERRSDARIVIVESLHDEACRLLPLPAEVEAADEELPVQATAAQQHVRLPGAIDTLIAGMGGRYEQLRQGVGTNWDASEDRNRIYLGTYLPRTIIEAWNILSELLSQDEIRKAFRAKDRIRILDIGSGTGGAVIGALLALRNAGFKDTPVDITSWDANADALMKQRALIESIAPGLPFPVELHTVGVMLPQETNSYFTSLHARIDEEGRTYDLVLCWKYLCEFYNHSYLQALGVVKNTLSEVSHALTPNSLFIVADITAKDNNHEWFPIILNRESQQFLREQPGKLRTILPIPCAKKLDQCSGQRCFSQRQLSVSHALRNTDTTRIAYRVLAPTAFAERIVAEYPGHTTYRVNARALHEHCIVTPTTVAAEPACGYTAM